jgi:hypothetical protein
MTQFDSASFDIPQFRELVYQGLAQERTGTYYGDIYCPGFGEQGWTPLCWIVLDGNPMFKAFDSLQELIQNSIVLLHNFFQYNLCIENSYGLSIVVFTMFIRLILSPVTFKQLETSELTTALQPTVAEIKEKYAD